MNEELKPCPFCGGEAEVFDLQHENAGTYWIVCCKGSSTNCAYEGHFDKPTREEAISAWNRRV